MVDDSSLSLGRPTPCRASLELIPPHSLSSCIDCPYMLLNLNELCWCSYVLPSFCSSAAPSLPFCFKVPPNYLPSITVPLINIKLFHFRVTKVLYNIIGPLLPQPSPLSILQTLFDCFSSPCKLHFIVPPIQICFCNHFIVTPITGSTDS
jgi:hypothetical protein